MAEKSISVQAPGWLWKGAVVTSAALAVLEACGVAKVPWFVALLPIALVVGISLAMILALLVGGLIFVIIAVLLDKPKRAKGIYPNGAKPIPDFNRNHPSNANVTPLHPRGIK